jgi:hypothetical protein
MPRETTAFVVFLGLGLGMLWGILSLLGMDHPDVWPPIVAPLWVTSLIAVRVPIHPLLIGAVVSAVCGVVPVALLFALARLRGA